MCPFTADKLVSLERTLHTLVTPLIHEYNYNNYYCTQECIDFKIRP